MDRTGWIVTAALLAFMLATGSYWLGQGNGIAQERAADAPVIEQLRGEKAELSNQLATQIYEVSHLNRLLQNCPSAPPPAAAAPASINPSEASAIIYGVVLFVTHSRTAAAMATPAIMQKLFRQQ